jgi:uncharacterized membrane protein YidH (DUF202 family)
MTPIVGFFLAIIAGWFVRDPKRAAATVVIPYLAVTAVQTWDIANGYGISPPDTVTPLTMGGNGSLPYYVVQLVFGLLAVGIAAELAVLRRRTLPAAERTPAAAWQRAAVATAIQCIGLLVLLVASMSQLMLVTHHSSSGSPPLQGLVGMLLCVVGFVALGVAVIRGRHAAPSMTGAPEPTTVTSGDR